MERGSGLYRYPGHAKRPATSDMSLMQGDNSGFNAGNFPNFTFGTAGSASENNTTGMLLQAPGQQLQQRQQRKAPQCGVREQDQYLPIANVIRIMRKILPPHAKISDDAKETIQECVSEYISFVTGEANERCQREQRKTITADDVLWAMGKLGFDEYVEPLSVFLSRYRESENVSLREPILKRSAMEYANRRMPNYAAPAPAPAPAPIPTFPTVPENQGAYDPSMFTGYYRDDQSGAGGSSSSQNAQANYDPFIQFK